MLINQFIIPVITLIEFRECFYLHARSGHINTLDELTTVMRSLGASPTMTELKDYLKAKGSLSFADFLDVMHQHKDKENVPKELLDAFRCMDVSMAFTNSYTRVFNNFAGA